MCCDLGADPLSRLVADVPEGKVRAPAEDDECALAPTRDRHLGGRDDERSIALDTGQLRPRLQGRIRDDCEMLARNRDHDNIRREEISELSPELSSALMQVPLGR